MSIIEVKNLTKKFKKFTAVDSISFNVEKGEIFGFLGPNGAGKSTTIRILTTLLTPTKGSAQIAGYDIKKDQDEIRTKIGLVAEKIILYNLLTARENLEFFGGLNNLSKDEINKRSEKWVDRLGMTNWMDSKVRGYSTGMKQRINIVRALLTEPEIIFLDEPTLGLDPQTTYLIRKFIEELRAHGTTVILTTHNMIEAEALCDRLAVIDQGKIVAVGTTDELKKQVPDKDNPTLEDVFLQLTGFDVRNEMIKAAPSSGGGHGPMRGGGQNRVR
ncbi:MAG: ABC transporter ATP-binding protein [bacterium]